MAGLSFELAVKIIPVFKGSRKEMYRASSQNIKNELKPHLIDFVFSVKLKNNVRTLLASK